MRDTNTLSITSTIDSSFVAGGGGGGGGGGQL